MAIYLSGPMTGHPYFNVPEFEKATKRLREDGHEVVSPVEMDGDLVRNACLKCPSGTLEELSFYVREFNYEGALERDLAMIRSHEIDSVVCLPLWWKSKGARAEINEALDWGKPVRSYPTLELIPEEEWSLADKEEGAVRETILDEAQRIVGGDRGDQYGHPGDDFERTAGAWKSLFGWDVTAEQVALAMIVVKLSRLQQTPNKRDSCVDIAGYARTYEMVMERDHGGLA